MKKIKWADFTKNYIKTYTIPAGATINTDQTGVKILLIYASMITGSGVLIKTSSNGVLEVLGSRNSAVYSINDEIRSIIHIYRDTSGYIHISNNSANTVNDIVVELLNL